MVELQDDEYEALITAINTYKKTNEIYEAQITKLQEELKCYDKELAKLRNISQKSLKTSPKVENKLSIMTLD